MDQNILEGIYNLIDNIDVNRFDIESYYYETQRVLEPLSPLLGLGRIEMHYTMKSNLFDLKGKYRTVSREFSNEVDYEQKIEQSYSILNEIVDMSFYSIIGKEWTEDQKNGILAISKIMYIVFSRITTVDNLIASENIDLATGLKNYIGVQKEYFETIGDENIENYTAFFINLKNFTLMNRRLGEKEADRIMRNYALAVCSHLKDSELAARLGGDNFYICIRNSSVDNFLSFLENVSFHSKDIQGNDTIATVYSRYGRYNCSKGDTFYTSIENSSFALSEAKKLDRNYVDFSEVLLKKMVDKKRIIKSFEQAIANKEIIPYYQPKVDVNTNTIVGVEVLARWIKGEYVITPSDFLEELEKHGMIKDLDLTILDAACADLSEYIRDSGDNAEPVRMSVNISKLDLEDPLLAEEIMEIINTHGVPREYIEIEITETSGYKNYDMLKKFIDSLHSFGVFVSMDDFGSGYTSIHLIQSLDFDVVKIDKSMIDKIDDENSTKDRIVLSNIVSMINELDMDVVSEGVENEAQIEFIRSIGCNMVQGYYYDKPLPKEEFISRLLIREYKKLV